MGHTSEFEILFRKKIPYWSTLLFGLMGTFFTFLFLFYLVMLPSDKASGEMKVAYYILVVPNWLKQASAYSFVGLLVLIPLYSISKSYHSGQLILDRNTFQLSGASLDKTMPVDSIRKIMLNDVRRGLRNKEVIEVVIKQTANRTTSFLLKHYLDAEALMVALSAYENIEFVFYNEISMMTHDDDL